MLAPADINHHVDSDLPRFTSGQMITILNIWLQNAVFILDDTQPELVYNDDYCIPERVCDSFVEDMMDNMYVHGDPSLHMQTLKCIHDGLVFHCLNELMVLRNQKASQFIGADCYSFENDDVYVIEVHYG